MVLYRKPSLEWRISSGHIADYDGSIALMENRVDAIWKRNAPELVWLLEYSSIYTMGISGSIADIYDESVPLAQTNRGGKCTYHGPGQRVVYLILDLKKRNMCDVKVYIRKLGEWIINVLNRFGVKGYLHDDRIGVWVKKETGEAKIAALGVRVKKWITSHGVAINIIPNLSYYDGINPCGLREYGITSLSDLGVNILMSEFDDALREEFFKLFPVT